MNTRRDSSGGYVLLLVAMTVAIMSLFILLAANVQGQLSGAIRSLREEARLDLDAHSALQRTAFLVVTEPMGHRALLVGADRDTSADGSPNDLATMSASGRRIEPLTLDGRDYVLGGVDPRHALIVSVQDESGLLNLNGGDEIGIANLLQLNGLNETVAKGLAGALADYVDGDDAVRQFGAEAPSYLRAGLAAPPNHRLATSWSALDALGWRGALNPRLRRLYFDEAAAGQAENVVNVNTAPAQVLMAVFNIDARTAQTMITRREAQPFRSSDEVLGLTGESTRAEAPRPATMPGSAFRVRVRVGGVGGAQRSFEGQLVIAPGQADRPVYWRDGWLSRNVDADAGAARSDAAPGAFPASPNELTP